MKNTGKLSIAAAGITSAAVTIDRDVINKVMYLVKTWPQECQWFHTIQRTVLPHGKLVYHLDGFFVPTQETSSVTVDSDKAGMYELYNAVKQDLNIDLSKEEDRKTYNNTVAYINAWCHSHVNMKASPSSVDETTFADTVEHFLKHDVNNPCAMIIINKAADFYCRIFDPVYNIYVENPPLTILDSDSWKADVDAIIKSRLKKAKPVTPKRYGNQFFAGAQVPRGSLRQSGTDNQHDWADWLDPAETSFLEWSAQESVFDQISNALGQTEDSKEVVIEDLDRPNELPKEFISLCDRITKTKPSEADSLRMLIESELLFIWGIESEDYTLLNYLYNADNTRQSAFLAVRDWDDLETGSEKALLTQGAFIDQLIQEGVNPNQLGHACDIAMLATEVDNPVDTLWSHKCRYFA